MRAQIATLRIEQCPAKTYNLLSHSVRASFPKPMLKIQGPRGVPYALSKRGRLTNSKTILSCALKRSKQTRPLQFVADHRPSKFNIGCPQHQCAQAHNKYQDQRHTDT